MNTYANEGSHAALLLHCHIPKTAGTTVSAGLRKSFGQFHFHHWHPDPHYILTQDRLEALLEMYPVLRSIGSHHLRSFPLSVGGRSTFLFTFLRKPEDVFLSQLKFIQREFPSLPAQVRQWWPHNTPNLTLRELAGQYLDQVTTGQDFSPQTRFLCSPQAGAQLGLSDGNSYGLDCYEMARMILCEFHFVGIVEEMKKSLQVLTDRLLQYGIRAYFDFNLKLNACRESLRPEWLTPTDEVGRRVLLASESDRLLHRYFLEKLLKSYKDLREHQWLGFGPAAAVAREAAEDGWQCVARSLVTSASLYRKRRSCRSNESIAHEPSSDLLESRAARALGSGHSATAINPSKTDRRHQIVHPFG